MKKIISLILVTVMVMGIVPFANVSAADNSAIVADGGWGLNGAFEYHRNDNGNWDTIYCPFWRNLETGGIAYCLESNREQPNGESYSPMNPSAFYSVATQNGIKAILLHGYPNNTSISAMNARYATQLAIWSWMYESAGVGYAFYSPSRLRAKSGYEEVWNLYQSLLTYARNNNQSFTHGISANPTTVILNNVGGQLKGTTTVQFNNLNGYFTIDQSKLPLGISISPTTGGNGTVLTITSTNAFDGQTISMTDVVVGHDSRQPTNVFWYEPDDTNYQNIVVFDMVYYPVARTSIAFRVNTGNLSILKTSQHNGGSVSGFTFEVRNSAGTLIGTYTSTSSGKIDIPNLQPGVYSVKEVNLSSDFVEPTPNPKSVTVNAGQTASVSFDNIKKRGVITVRKTDANPTMGGYSLAGAVFEVRDAGGTLVDTITTDSSGRAQTKILPLGVYRVKETKAPYGFVLDTETRNATISGTQGTHEIVYAPDVTVAEQPQVGRINIEKYNSNPAMGDYALTPAVFEIRNSSGVLVDTITTDAQGKAQSKDLKLGDYTVTEKTAPYGYVRNTNTLNVKLEYGGQTESRVYKTVSVPEAPQTGIIRVHKYNKTPDIGDYPLNGAVFEVRAAADIKQRDGTIIYNKGDLADTITTNAAGEAQTRELPLGAYTVREKTAPYGFVLNTETYNPVLSYAGQETAVTYTDATVPEQPQVGTITITKLDKVTGTRSQGDSTLNGAVFEVYAAADIKKLDGSFIYKKDQLVDTLYCGTNSSVTSKELPLGDYYYKEKVPPVGYTLDTASYPVAIEYAGQNVAVVKKYGDLKNKVIEGQVAITKHTDDPDPDVQPSNPQVEAPLEGAIFEVFLKSAGSYDKALLTERDLITTDENGYAKTKLLPYGIYTVKETYAPGDVKLVEPFDVFISKDGNVYRYILSDPHFRSLVKIIKVDSETGKTIPAAGVSFKVKDLSTGQWVSQSFNYPTPTTIDVFETAPDGTLVMPGSLKSGDYELYEQEAPYGYVLSKKPVKFTIHSTQENPEIIEVLMANNPAKGIIKVKKKGNMLTDTSVTDTTFGKQYTPIFSLTGLKGAVFNVIAAENIYTGDGTLRYEKGTVVDTITTNANGYAESKQLYLGNYTVVETKAPEGFVIDKTPHAVSLVYEGQEISVVSSQIGIGNIRQTVEIELQKLMEKPVNAPEDFSAFRDVIFGLFADEDIKAIDGSIAIPKGSLVALMQIDENGKGVISGELPFAKYYVQELQTNIYYQLNSTKYAVNAEYQEQDVATAKIQVNNGGIAIPNETKLGRITILKTGEMLVGASRVVGKGDVYYTPQWEIRGLPDVTFDVVAAEDIYNVYGKLLHKKGDIVDTITTDTDGIATSKLLHLGKYELVEKTVPYGYVSDGKPVPVTLGFDGQLMGEYLEKTVSIYNERQKAEITLNKVMEMPENPPEGFNPYADVRFGLYAKEDIKDASGEVVIPAEACLEEFGVDGVSDGTANGKGIIKTDLPIGSYYIKEIMTASGYVIDDTAYDVVFDYNSTAGALVTIAVNSGEPIENRLMRGSLKIIKSFEGKETPIAGVPFTITGETTIGTTVEINAVTDENGEILLKNLLVGNYTVKELESDLTVGYVLSPEENAVVAADEIAEMTIENKLQRGDLRIIKTFEGKSIPIKDVKFTVTGTSIAGILFEGEFFTDENGEIFIEGLPIGEYIVKEITSELTEGYVLSDGQTATVAIDELTEMTINNKLIRGNIKVFKTDSATGKPLAGAVFRLYKDGVLIAEAISGEDGISTFDNIVYGEYEIREISAPEGYKRTDEVFTVAIKENGETISIDISNQPVPTPDNPKTGDNSKMALWLVLMGLSAASFIGLTVAGKRRKRREEI